MSYCHYSTQGGFTCQQTSQSSKASTVEHFANGACGVSSKGVDYISGVYTKYRNPGEADKVGNTVVHYNPDTLEGTINYTTKFTCSYDNTNGLNKTRISVPTWGIGGQLDSIQINWDNNVNYSGRNDRMCRRDIISGNYNNYTYNNETYASIVKVKYDAKQKSGVINDSVPFMCVGNKIIVDHPQWKDITGVFDAYNIYWSNGVAFTNKSPL